jgi:hypothetical protein
MAKDLVITAENRPGVLAAIGEALGGAGINIEGLCAVAAAGRGTIHVIVEDVDRARSVLQDAGAQVGEESDVLVADLEDRPGAAGELARKLADAGVNINFAYLATRTRAVLGVDDVEKARAAL